MHLRVRLRVDGDGAGHDGHGLGHRVAGGRDHGDAPAQAMDVDAVGDLEDVRHVVADEDRPAMPRSRTSRMSCSTLPDSLTPSAAVGSSMMMTRLPKAAARATATPWRWPPESVSTAWLMSWMVSRPSLRHLLARASSRMPVEVEHAEDRAADARLAPLAAQEQVRGDVQGRADRQRLVDRLDAGGLGVVGRLEVDRLAVEQDLAAGRG